MNTIDHSQNAVKSMGPSHNDPLLTAPDQVNDKIDGAKDDKVINDRSQCDPFDAPVYSDNDFIIRSMSSLEPPDKSNNSGGQKTVVLSQGLSSR